MGSLERLTRREVLRLSAMAAVSSPFTTIYNYQTAEMKQQPGRVFYIRGSEPRLPNYEKQDSGKNFRQPRFDVKEEKNEVYVVDENGSTKRLTSNNERERSPVVSPDGRFLAYACIPQKPTPGFSSVGFPSVHVLDLRTGETYFHTIAHYNYEDLVWSPLSDGLAVKYSDHSENGFVSGPSMFFLKLEKGNPHMWDNGTVAFGKRPRAPSFSPNGQRVVYHTEEKELEISGNKIETGGRAMHPLWSPRGDKILFVSDRDRENNAKLHLISSEDSGKKQFVEDNFQAEFAMLPYNPGSWSPDGTKVAFDRLRVSKTEARRVIAIVDVDTGKTKEIPVEDKSPFWLPIHWHPSGKKLAFETSDGRGLNVSIVNADGTGLKQLTTHSLVERIIAYR